MMYLFENGLPMGKKDQMSHSPPAVSTKMVSKKIDALKASAQIIA